jgi:hypothetical protein
MCPHYKLEHLLGVYLGSGIAGSSGNTMSSCLKKCQTDFQSSCTSLSSHQQCRNVPLFPHPCQYLLSPGFLIFVILTGVRWNLRVALICISLMIKDAEVAFYASVFYHNNRKGTNTCLNPNVGIRSFLKETLF